VSDQDALWNQVYAAFKAHEVFQNPPLDMSRMFTKAYGDPSKCDIHEEVLSPDELRQLKRYGEFDDNPHRDVEPIIVWADKGERVVIDGRRRVTKWMNEGLDKPRRALIIKPRG